MHYVNCKKYFFFVYFEFWIIFLKKFKIIFLKIKYKFI